MLAKLAAACAVTLSRVAVGRNRSVMQKAVAQQVPRLDGTQFGQRDYMLLRDRVGKIGVDPDLLHVRDNEQRRVFERVGVLLQLRIGFNQVAALALVLPGEAMPLPNIGKAGSVADLRDSKVYSVPADPHRPASALREGRRDRENVLERPTAQYAWSHATWQ